MRFLRRAFLLVARDGQRPFYDDYVIAHRVRAAQMLPQLGFAIPRPGMKYPSSSWNAQLLAMRVSDIFPERLDALEDAIFGAMFRELRDVSDPAVLRECARAGAVPEAEVDEAIASPPIMGAVPTDMYRQALRNALGA